MHGAIFLAFSNNFLTLDAPSPANISINSEPLIEINGTPASPAMALAIKVFPVPGFPYNKIPLGIFAPISKYAFGFFRKSTISTNSFFSSSRPATSSNFILVFLFSSPPYILPLSPPIPCILNIIIIKASNKIVGSIENTVSIIFNAGLTDSWVKSIFNPSLSTFSCTNSIKAWILGTNTFFCLSFSSPSPFIVTVIELLPVVIFIFSTLSSFIVSINSV